MTLADNQFSIGGVTLGDGTSYLVEEVQGLGMPDARATDVVRPRDHGEFYGLDYLPGRTVTMTVVISAASAAVAYDALDALAAVWQPVPADTSSVLPLSYKLPSRNARQLNGRPRRSDVDLSQVGAGLITVTLQYKAADPRAYDAAPLSSSVGVGTVTSGRTYPRTYPLTFGGGTSNILQATNAGNFATRPAARILGPATNPKIENETTGEFVQFAITLAATDFLDIDFNARTVTLNGTTSRYSTLTTDSTWWELSPGTSDVRFIADASGGSTLMTLTWSSAWL